MNESADKTDQGTPAEPTSAVWRLLELRPEAEVYAGHQSRVFRATGSVGPVIVKLVEADRATAAHRLRIDAVNQLAELNPDVIGPVHLGEDLVIQVERWLAVCYPFVEGTEPDIGDRRDVDAMAETLASLHDSLRSLAGPALPPVAALEGRGTASLGDGQVIHGDYDRANLIKTPSGLKVIDFDDCGHGSIDFEIGNSLYMTLFDAWHSNRPERYVDFRRWFVSAYCSATSSNLDDAVLDAAIRARAAALDRWLTIPGDGAPTGIRTASTEWRHELRSFVNSIDSLI